MVALNQFFVAQISYLDKRYYTKEGKARQEEKGKAVLLGSVRYDIFIYDTQDFKLWHLSTKD